MMMIDLNGVAASIKQRSKVVRSLLKYNFPIKIYHQICKGFIGGKLNYYMPILGAETGKEMKSAIKPLETAYNEYMRTYSGAFRSTPIPLLHAMTGFPLLRDAIRTSATMTVLSAIANDTLLGREYSTWDGEGDGWSPLGIVGKTLNEDMPRTYTEVHPKVKLSEQTLEKLYQVQFHTSSRSEAIEKHLTDELLPQEPPIEIWTDGSLTPGENAGAAALVIDNREYPPTETVRETALSPVIVRSSYETELIALGCGLDVAIDENFNDTKVHIFSDSLSWIKQLQSLPTRPKRVHDEVAANADKLANLIENNNEVHIHFIPSHVPKPDEENTDTSSQKTECSESYVNTDTDRENPPRQTGTDQSPSRDYENPPIHPRSQMGNQTQTSDTDKSKANDGTNHTGQRAEEEDNTNTSHDSLPTQNASLTEESSEDDSETDSESRKRIKYLEIGHNEEIDKLAKRAAKKGQCGVNHTPLLSSYKLHLRRLAAERLEDYLTNNIKDSKWDDYPKRKRYIDDAWDIAFNSRKLHTHPLLNRARSGHSAARKHLHNIDKTMSGESDQCRHCNSAEETIEHQLVHCTALRHKLQHERETYERLWKNSFAEALWKYEDEMTRILKSAKSKRCIFI